MLKLGGDGEDKIGNKYPGTDQLGWEHETNYCDGTEYRCHNMEEYPETPDGHGEKNGEDANEWGNDPFWDGEVVEGL